MTVNWELLANIANTHRGHERFHSINGLDLALDMAKEAVKLKMLAEKWTADNPSESIEEKEIDYKHDWYQAAVCEDLNVTSAVAAIGILFTEGAGEPPEISTIKGKLSATSKSLQSISQYLDEKMDAAWDREYPTLESLGNAGYERYQTILNNYENARRLMLAGKLFALALKHISSIKFEPKIIRSDKKNYGHKLLIAGWLIDEGAGFLAAQSRAQLRNDPSWTYYLNKISRLSSNMTQEQE